MRSKFNAPDTPSPQAIVRQATRLGADYGARGGIGAGNGEDGHTQHRSDRVACRGTECHINLNRIRLEDRND